MVHSFRHRVWPTPVLPSGNYEDKIGTRRGESEVFHLDEILHVFRGYSQHSGLPGCLEPSGVRPGGYPVYRAVDASVNVGDHCTEDSEEHRFCSILHCS